MGFLSKQPIHTCIINTPTVGQATCLTQYQNDSHLGSEVSSVAASASASPPSFTCNQYYN